MCPYLSLSFSFLESLAMSMGQVSRANRQFLANCGSYHTCIHLEHTCVILGFAKLLEIDKHLWEMIHVSAVKHSNRSLASL